MKEGPFTSEEAYEIGRAIETLAWAYERTAMGEKLTEEQMGFFKSACDTVEELSLPIDEVFELIIERLNDSLQKTGSVSKTPKGGRT